jgi:hypothetical protein
VSNRPSRERNDPIGSYNGEQVCVTALNAVGTSGTDTSLGCDAVLQYVIH